MMSRRNMMLAAPIALTSLAAASTFDGSAAADPHPAWLEEWFALRDMWRAEFNKDDEDTEDSDAIWEERDRIEKLIYTTPPKTLDGIRAQIAWVLEDSGGDFTCVGHLEALTLTVGALQ